MCVGDTHAPGVAKVDLINPHEDYGDPSSGFMGGPVLTVSAVQSRHNDMGNAHSHSASNQDGLASELVNVQDGWNGGKEHENAADTAGK